MYKIEGKTIYLVRGDTFQTQVAIKQNGTDYTPVQGDIVRFALKRNQFNHDKTQYLDKEPLVLKTIPIDTLILELEPNDTAGLNFGEYDYDIEITMANGRVDTFISGKMHIKPEVH